MLVIITVITLFVGGLLVWVMWRYQRHAQSRCRPAPRTTRSWRVAWTVIPVLILVVIAIPSFRLVYYEDRTHDADMTIKVTGHQWYWEYTYPDQGNLDFTSYIIPDDQLKPGQLRLLEVDNQLVVPVGKNIRVLADQHRRDPQLVHPVARRAALRDPRADHRDLVQRRQARHLLRRVQPDLRHQPQPHADRGARGAGAGIQHLARSRRRPSSRMRRRRSAGRATRRRPKFGTDPHGRRVKEPDDVGDAPTTTRTMHHDHKPGFVARWLFSTNHKDIGTLYLMLRVIARRGRRHAVDDHARAAAVLRATHIVTDGQEWNTIITAHGLMMIFFSVMPATDRRLRQLVRAADDRRAGHGVPAPEQHQLLAAAAGVRC